MENRTVTGPYIGANEYGAPTLYVKGEPFLILGGELHNSAASSLEYMEREVWPYVRPLGLNTVILPVAWETIEPEEGHFDFQIPRGLIDQARREGVKLVLLWFGLWKNGESFYVPAWVKEDYHRFFRACYAGGGLSETVSPFCEEAVAADRIAFGHFMEFLREYDREEQTVVMVQVENEIGFLRSDRDYSAAAEAAFAQEIPKELGTLYQTKGSWSEAFGEDAPEYFMAWHYARDVQQIAAAGAEIYPLPLYVNAWLEQHPDRPGAYPSGGPVAKLIPLWKLAAPALSLFAPDIYLPDFDGVCRAYSVCGNPLFIPEARRDPVTASNVFYAFGGWNALGYSPFAVEDFLREEEEKADRLLLAQLNIDVSGFDPTGTGPFYRKSCEVLSGILPLLAKYRGSKRLLGFCREPLVRGKILPMEGYDLQLDYLDAGAGHPGCGGLILIEDHGFYIAGCNVRFRVLPKKGSRSRVTVVRLEEGVFENGLFKAGRVLNGDERDETCLGSYAGVLHARICVYNCD